MTEEKKEEKKIIVDEDWKSQAKKEKETQAQKEKTPETQPEQQQEQEQQAQRQPLPKGDFAALVSMLVTQALFALGLIQIEGQDKRQPDLEMAKYNIDMLETLEEKTKGNLTETEKKVLSTTLNQVRMVFVEVSSKA